MHVFVDLPVIEGELGISGGPRSPAQAQRLGSNPKTEEQKPNS